MEELLDKIAKLTQEAKNKIKYETKDIRPITERVKTFEDACRIVGKYAPLFYENNRKETEMEDIITIRKGIALRKLEIITKALNEGWTPNWDDDNERKWIPYFVMSAAGFRFSGSFCDDSVAIAGCGSRLRFKSEALAKYTGEQFTELYKEIML